MCNYCIATYITSSRNKAYIGHLLANLVDVYSNSNDKSLQHLATKYGYYDKKASIILDNTDYIDICDTEISEKEGVYYFQFSIVSKWTPDPDIFFAISHDHYKNNVNIAFIAEEPGLQLFQIYDDTSVWFRSRFRLSYCYKGECKDFYFEYYADAIAHIQDTFPNARVSMYDSIADVEKRVNNSYDENDDFFFSLNAFVRYENLPYDKERSVA